MKKNDRFNFKTTLFSVVFIAFNLVVTISYAQQNIGAHANIDAGFETQTVGNLPSQTSASPNISSNYWAYTSSGNGQIRSISATGGYGGPKYLSVGKVLPTVNSSTTAVSNLLTTNTFSANTKYIAQFHYKINTGAIDTALSSIFLSGDNTSGTRASSNLYGLTTNTTWTKYTRVITTGTYQSTTGTFGIVARMVGSASTTNTTFSGVIDIDNVVVYPADDQTNPVADITAPNAVTGLSATGNPAVVSLTWNAPAGGVDGGGYMVVRYSADPSTEPAPLQNAVYKATATNTIGTTGTVVYVGTDNFLNDGSGVIGTNYWYRVYAVDKAFNYATAATTGPAASTPKINFYYDGTGGTDQLTNWWSNSNGTGSHPVSFTNAGQVYHILSAANLLSTLSISGVGSGLIIGDAAGVPAFTVDFNSSTLPQIDTLYQSLDGNPMVLNYNNANVPSINQLYDIFTQIHYRASGIPISVGTTKDYDAIYIENGADVTFNGGSSTSTPPKANYFFVEQGASATIGTLSSRWLQIKAGGSAVVNGKLATPKLAGLESNNTFGVPASTGGAIQFDDAGSTITFGPASTIEYSSTSSTTTQLITPRADYVNMIISGTGVSKTINAPIGISGNLTLNTTGATGLLLTDGLTGTGALNINGVVTLSAGKINTDATNILVLGNNATVVGGNSTSYVNGPVKRNTAGTGNYTLPTGKGGMYRPVTIKPAATTASVYQSEFFNTPYSVLTVTAPLTNVDTTYWDVTKISGANASVALTLDGGTAIPNATGADELVVAHFVGSTWLNVSATPINPGTSITGTATSTVQTTFSPFTIGLKPTSVLPVTLVSFKAALQQSKAKLSWTTTGELNLVGYMIEESKDGINFTQIGNVAARNTTGMNFYTFNANNIINNQFYYRLKINSLDGRNQYSNIVSLKNYANNPFTIISNPVQDRTIRFQLNSIPVGKYEMGLLATNGQLIQKQSIDYNGTSIVNKMIVGATLPSGIYIVRVTGNNFLQETKIIIE